MKLHYLSKREKNILFNLIDKTLPLLNIEKIKDIRSIQIDTNTAIVISDSFILINLNDNIFPFLKDKKTLGKLPIVTVDQGAIRFICNGANIMRPGIKHIKHDFQKNTPRSIYNKMNKTQRDLLGFRFNPPKDEFTGGRAKQKKHQKPENYTPPV